MERSTRDFWGLPSWCTLLCLAAAATTTAAADPLPPYYNAIFSFGDSFSDTGNFVIINSGKLPNMPKFPPPYARCSNGRLVIDFLAEALGVPLLPPSANTGTNFSQGANFAVMGATALDLQYFKDNNVWSIPPFNTSMNCQLEWFQEIKNTICATPQDYLQDYSYTPYLGTAAAYGAPGSFLGGVYQTGAYGEGLYIPAWVAA